MGWQGPQGRWVPQGSVLNVPLAPAPFAFGKFVIAWVPELPQLYPSCFFPPDLYIHVGDLHLHAGVSQAPRLSVSRPHARPPSLPLSSLFPWGRGPCFLES